MPLPQHAAEGEEGDGQSIREHREVAVRDRGETADGSERAVPPRIRED